MPDFANLLNVQADEVKELPVLPAGDYLATVGQFKFEVAKTKDGDKQVVNVPFTLRSAVAVQGDLPPRLPELKQTFWLTNSDGSQDEFTLDPLKRFIEACGVQTSGRTLGESLPETKGASVTLTVGHRLNPKNPERPFAQINNIAAA